MSNSLILVPARYGSSRFPGKPLAKINNKTMIEYVIKNCEDSGLDYSVVTDNDEIENFLNNLKKNVVRVDDDVTTGSERIFLAYKRYFADKNYQQIINVQGDEPLLRGNLIKEISNQHLGSNFDIFTAVKKRMTSDTEFLNSNVVKCIYSEKSKKCFYFSRASIPFDVAADKSSFWFQHIGLYSYLPDALESFVSFEESYLEKTERLEQLRALENNLSIGAQRIDVDLIGVDTPDDIIKVEGALCE